MKTEELINKHQTCIDILEGVYQFESLIELNKDNLKSFTGTFPKLRKKYLHNIEIYEMCIARLMQRYNNILN